MNENTVEQAAMLWFWELGYQTLYGPDIAPEEPKAERKDFSEVVLQGRLAGALEKINPTIPGAVLQEVVQKLARSGSPSLIENNRRFHRWLTDGVDVEYQNKEGQTVHDKVWLIDFDKPGKNDWLAVNQLTVIENKHNRRPDIVVFVNGLPLAVIELKNPADEDATIKTAFRQIQTYKHHIPSLFHFNELLVVSDGTEARFGSLTADWERFMPWRKIEGEEVIPKGEAELEVVTKGIFAKERFLNLVRNFVAFDEIGGAPVKRCLGAGNESPRLGLHYTPRQAAGNSQVKSCNDRFRNRSRGLAATHSRQKSSAGARQFV